MTTEDQNLRILHALQTSDAEGLLEYRKALSQFYQLAGSVHFSGEIEESYIDTPTQLLRVKIYTPDTALTNEAMPVILYFHGGGWSAGSIDSTTKLAQKMAMATQSVVLTPEYRLAPEHPYPAAFENAYAALQWTFDQTTLGHWDANRISVAGDSAGGNLAAAISLRSRDTQGPHIATQLLIYPVLLPLNQQFDDELNAIGVPPNAAYLRAVGKAYAGTANTNDPYLSPLAEENLQGLPPTLIITAGFDLLTPQGNEYAKKLQKQGVPVKTVHFPEVGHGFFSMVGILNETEQAMVAIDTFVQQHPAKN